MKDCRGGIFMKLEKVTIAGVVYYKEIVEDDTPIKQEESHEGQEDAFW